MPRLVAPVVPPAGRRCLWGPGTATSRPRSTCWRCGTRRRNRKATARAGRAGYVLNRKKSARLLKARGFLSAGEAAPEGAGHTVRHHRLEPPVANRHDQYLVRGGLLGSLHRRHQHLTTESCWAGRSPRAAAPPKCHRRWRRRGRRRSPAAEMPACRR